MSEAVLSVVDLGSQGVLVEIECHLSNNLPSIIIVGSASKSVDEAKERVRAAFVSSGLQLPRKRITINLAPADLPKTDSSFDLAMSMSILVASKQIPPEELKRVVVIGEQGLNGSIRPVRGIIGKVLAGRKLGITDFIIPAANLDQAQLVPGVNLLPVNNLKQLYDHLATRQDIAAISTGKGLWDASGVSSDGLPAVSEVVGQEHAKRALEIAAAGGHNVLLSGPPGTGKSMLAKALPTLLPPLSHEEALEITHLHSLATHDYSALLTARPLRAPHHSASLVSIVGGGHNLRPGEISLAHRGVLFMDEMPEFSRTTVEALRQPLEDHVITVSRAKDSVSYPANFILIATANPCPCGYYGSSKPCSCLPHQIQQYQQRMSGPILDRIDLHSTVQDINHRDLLGTTPKRTEDGSRQERILHARSMQRQRYNSEMQLNADMSNRHIKLFAHLTPQAKEMLDVAAERLNVSARSYMKVVKVARTIADLDRSTSIEQPHIAEALQYRRAEQSASL